MLIFTSNVSRQVNNQVWITILVVSIYHFNDTQSLDLLICAINQLQTKSSILLTHELFITNNINEITSLYSVLGWGLLYQLINHWCSLRSGFAIFQHILEIKTLLKVVHARNPIIRIIKLSSLQTDNCIISLSKIQASRLRSVCMLVVYWPITLRQQNSASTNYFSLQSSSFDV